jgi:hypothetical protein
MVRSKTGSRGHSRDRRCTADLVRAGPGVGSCGRCPLLAGARRYPAAAEIGLDESVLPLKLLVWLCSEGLKIASGL